VYVYYDVMVKVGETIRNILNFRKWRLTLFDRYAMMKLQLHKKRILYDMVSEYRKTVLQESFL